MFEVKCARTREEEKSQEEAEPMGDLQVKRK